MKRFQETIIIPSVGGSGIETTATPPVDAGTKIGEVRYAISDGNLYAWTGSVWTNLTAGSGGGADGGPY